MVQMPAGIPTATMGIGNSGFINACLFACQGMALANPTLKEKMNAYRQKMKKDVIASDNAHKVIFKK